MTASMRIRRLAVGAAATGLLAGGAAFGLAGTANATPATAAAASVVTGDHHDQHSMCKWHKGHWERQWVKAHWEKKQFDHRTWRQGHYDMHGQWHKGYWEDHSYFKWIYVPAHWEYHWVNGYWDCRHH